MRRSKFSRAEKERVGGVANVQVIPLEIGLEQDDGPIAHGPEDEIVHQQVGPHPRADAEDRGQAESDDVARVEQDLAPRPPSAWPYRLIGRSGVSSVQNFPFSPIP